MFMALKDRDPVADIVEVLRMHRPNVPSESESSFDGYLAFMCALNNYQIKIKSRELIFLEDRCLLTGNMEIYTNNVTQWRCVIVVFGIDSETKVLQCIHCQKFLSVL